MRPIDRLMLNYISRLAHHTTAELHRRVRDDTERYAYATVCRSLRRLVKQEYITRISMGVYLLTKRGLEVREEARRERLSDYE
jgi:DNA-binding PadR family transcriptional regulator